MMIDARRLSCPMPVVMLQKVIAKDHFPAALEILVDARKAVENVTRYTESEGYQVKLETQETDFKLTLAKGTRPNGGTVMF